MFRRSIVVTLIVLTIVIAVIAVIAKTRAGHENDLVGKWKSSFAGPGMDVDFQADNAVVVTETVPGHTMVFHGTYATSSAVLKVTLSHRSVDGVDQPQPSSAQPMLRTYTMHMNGKALTLVDVEGRTPLTFVKES
jgi:hypothetical protein